MFTPSNSAATDRPWAVWVALGLAVAMGVLAVRLSGRPTGAASPVPPVALYPYGPSQIPPLRILIALPSAQPLQIRISGPYRVVVPGDWRVLAQGRDLPETPVTAAERGLQLGPRAFEADKLDVRVVRPGTLRVGGRRYHGDLRLLRRGKGLVAAVNVIDLEQFVADVVAGPPADGSTDGSPPAARDALAIAARTCALYRMKTLGPEGDWDLRWDAGGLS